MKAAAKSTHKQVEEKTKEEKEAEAEVKLEEDNII